MKSKFLICLLCLFSLSFLVSCSDDSAGENNGETSTEHEHTYSDEWSNDEKSHWHQATCEHADKVKDKKSHTYVDGVCSVCGFQEADINEHTHDGDDVYLSDEKYHWHQCSCGEIYSKKSHRFDAGTIIKEPTENSSGLKVYKCKTCGYEKEEVVDPTQTDHNHILSEFKYNEDGHWQECIECGELLTKDMHIFDSQPFEDDKGHGMIHTCYECGYQKIEYSIEDHVCKPISREFYYDENSHWQECSCGQMLNYSEHNFEMIYSDTYEIHYMCSLCKYSKIEYVEHIHEFSNDYMSDENYHWHYAICGCDSTVVDGYEEHKFNSWYVIVEPQLGSDGIERRECEVCYHFEERLIPALEHTEHEFSDSYMYDEEKHWQYCYYCDATREEGPHEYGEWEILWAPTETSEGREVRYCICGMNEFRDVPPVEHVHTVWVYSITLEPTLYQTGTMVGTCAYCNEEVSVTMPVLNDTDYIIDNIYTPSTCQTLGYASYKYVYEDTYYWVNGDLAYADHSYVDGKCEYCELEKVTIGLEYELAYSGDSYWIIGIGSCTDTDLIIPSEYNGLPVTRINKYAFKDCTQLTSVTIPLGVDVYEGAFTGCYNIESITLPTGAIYDPDYSKTYPLGYIFGYESYQNSYDAWQYIPGAANYGEHFFIPNGLKTITLTGDSTKTTGVGAFDALVSLETVNFIGEFEYINNSTFQGCTNLRNINLKDTNVYRYNTQAFSGCASLTSDQLLFEGLTYIDMWALSGCVGLDSNLVIPESVTTICHSAFSGIDHIESITLNSFGTHEYTHFAYLFGNRQFNEADKVPAGLKEITIRNAMVFEKYAFYSISSLEKLNLHPDSTIKENSIVSCGLDIYTNEGNAYYLGVENNPYHWLMQLSDFTVTEFNINENCKKIVANAFFSYIVESNITKLVIPNSVVEISDTALRGLSNLEELTIPYVGMKLDEELEYDTLSRLGTIFGTNSYNNSYNANGYYIPNSLKKVTVGVADYGQYAFKDVTSLEELVILSGHADAWTSSAFAGCSNLKTLYVANVGSLGSYFGEYQYDNSYKVTYSIWVSSIGQMRYYDYYIPNSLEEVHVISGDIKENAFDGLRSIKKIVLSGGSTIQVNAFRGCDFESVEILDTFTVIPENTFKNMTSLKEVSLCDTITSIGTSAFYGCSSLDVIELPSSIDYIGEFAFYGCSSLESIGTFGNVTEIQHYAFAECSNLVIPSLENVTYVGEAAFENCLKLEEVIINNVQFISSNAFEGCENIHTFDFTYSGLELPLTLFAGKENLKTVSITAYSSYNIPSGMFENCSSLETLALNFTIYSIGDRAFAGCSSLKELHLPTTISYIGKDILVDAESLESITLPYIGGDTEDTAYFGYIFGAPNAETQAEYVPETLTKVVININSVIPTNAFYGLSQLTYLDLSKCTSIDYNALVGCDNLEYLGISTIPVSYERSPLGFLFGAENFGSNAQYVPKTLKTLRVDNVDRIMQNLTHGLVLEELYIGSNVGGIYDAFTDGTTKCHITNAYYESTFEDWLTLFIRGNNGNPAFVSDNFYFLSEEGEYYLPEVMTLSKEQIGHEIVGFESIKELVIEPSVTRFASYFSSYQFDKVYYNGTLADYFNVSFDFDNSNPLQYTNEFYYLDEYGNYVLFDGNLIIPYGVTNINKYSLYINGLTSVILPDTLESLEANAILDVTALKLNEYENGYYLGTNSNPHYMFVSVVDTTATDVVINENTKIIASYAFKDSSVTELVVPSTVLTIERYAFHTDSLTKITLPLANMNDKDSNGNAYFYNMFIKQSHYGRLPENLTTVVVNRADYIPQYYFSSCSNITDITLPEDVEFANESISYFTETQNIYNNAYYIGSLDNPYMILLRGIDNTVTSFEVHPDTTMVNQGALAGFNSLTELTISNINEDEVLGKYFDDSRYNTTSNSKVPTTIETLKVLRGKLTSKTFKNMSLINLYITSDCEAVEANGKYDFGGFSSIVNVYFMGTLEDWCMMEFKSETATPMRHATYIYMINDEGEYEQVTKLDISNMIEVKDYQFYGFDYVTLLIVDGYKSFNPNAFGRCRGLTAIGYYGSAPYNFADNFTGMNIEQLYIFDCSYLYNVPYFAGLKTLRLPENLEYVDGSAFEYYTSNIESIHYPGTVEDWLNVRMDNYNYNPMYYANNFYVKVDEYADGSISLDKLTKLEVSTQLNYFQFAGLKSLEELIILEGARVDYAFYGCTNIKKISGNFENINLKNAFTNYMGEYSGPTLDTLTMNGESIGAGSFYNVKANDVYISNTVTTIGDSAFSNANIENLYIPTSVKTINRDAFLGANISRVYYEGSAQDWCNVVLKSIDANPMMSTPNFYVLDSTGEYILLESVEIDYAGDYQFAGLKTLQKFTLKDGGTLGNYVVYHCNNLEFLTISLDSSITNYYNGDVSSLSSLTIIGDAIGSYALNDLGEIRELTISSSVKEIGYNAFNNTKVKNLYFDGTVDEWCGVVIKTFEGSYVYQNNNPMNKATNVYFRNENGEYERMTKIEISAEAGKYQFTGLEQLEEVVVLEGGKLGDYSLYNCSNLTKLTYTSEEKRIGVYFSNTPDGYTIPTFDTLTFTGEVISAGSLGYYTINVENLVLANSIKQTNTSFNSVNITNLYFDGTIEEWFNVIFTNGSPVPHAENLYVKVQGEYQLVTEISIPENVDTINPYQFEGYKIETLIIPANITRIEEGAFKDCTSLEEVVLPETLEYIGDNAFLNCSTLTEIVIPDSVTYIGLNAFSGCKKLEKVSIPFVGTNNGTNNQFYNVFGANSSVKEVVITGGDKIPSNAFYKSSAIEKVILPEGITALEVQAFSGLTKLTEINIPSTITLVSKYAFYNCSSLKEIVIPAGATVEENAFQKCSSLIKLGLPGVNPDKTNATGTNEANKGNVMYYIDTYTTLTFKEYLVNLDEVIINGGNVCANAFQNATNINTLTLNNVKTVEAYAFSGCSSLETVNIHNDLTLYQVIKGYAFQNCTALTYLDLSESYDAQRNSFIGCDNVRELKVSTLKNGTIYSIFSNSTIPFETITSTSYRATSVTADLAELTVENVVLEEGVESLSYTEFEKSTITNLYLPSTLTSISFREPTTITNAYYNGTIEDWTKVNVSYDGVFKYIENFYFNVDGEYVLSTEINSVYINGVADLGSYLFADYKGLEEVVISKDVTNIYEYTFKNCSNLEVFYEGTKEEWEKIAGWYYLTGESYGINANVHFNEETEVSLVNTYYFEEYDYRAFNGNLDEIANRLGEIYLNSTITLNEDGTLFFKLPAYEANGILGIKGEYTVNEDRLAVIYTHSVLTDGTEQEYPMRQEMGDTLVEDNRLLFPVYISYSGDVLQDIIYGVYVPAVE